MFRGSRSTGPGAADVGWKHGTAAECGGDWRQVDALLDEAEKAASRTATGSPEAMVYAGDRLRGSGSGGEGPGHAGHRPGEYPEAVSRGSPMFDLLVRRKKFDEAIRLLDSPKAVGRSDRIAGRPRDRGGGQGRPAGPRDLERHDQEHPVFPQGTTTEPAGVVGRRNGPAGGSPGAAGCGRNSPSRIPRTLMRGSISSIWPSRPPTGASQKQIEAIDQIDGMYAPIAGRCTDLAGGASPSPSTRSRRRGCVPTARALLADLRTRGPGLESDPPGFRQVGGAGARPGGAHRETEAGEAGSPDPFLPQGDRPGARATRRWCDAS